MIVEHYTGQLLHLCKRTTQHSAVEEKCRNRRRLKLGKLKELSLENEKELISSDVVVFFVLHRKLHTAPRIDTRGFRYISWAVTDMRDSFASFLFYGSSCDSMKQQTPGLLWLAVNPNLLPRMSDAKKTEYSEAASRISEARRAFSVSGADQLACVGKLDRFGSCMQIIGGSRICGNPVDFDFHGEYCSFHNRKTQKPPLEIKDKATETKSVKEGQVGQVGSSKGNTESTEQPSEGKTVSAIEKRTMKHERRLVELPHFSCDFATKSTSTDKKENEEEGRGTLIQKMCQTVAVETDVLAILDAIKKLKHLDLNASEISSALASLNSSLTRAKQSRNEDLASTAFLLERNWRKKLVKTGNTL